MSYPVTFNSYGFRWGDVLVERTASNEKRPKFQVIRVYAPNGEGVEIVMTPRKLEVKTFPRESARPKRRERGGK